MLANNRTPQLKYYRQLSRDDMLVSRDTMLASSDAMLVTEQETPVGIVLILCQRAMEVSYLELLPIADERLACLGLVEVIV